MNDFLKNLRSSHKKDKSDIRRSLDGHYYPKEDRRQRPDRRSGYSDNMNSMSVLFKDALPTIADNTSEMNQHLERYVEQNERLVEAKIRQAEALTDFVNNLNKIFTQEVAGFQTTGRPKASSSYTVGDHYTKADILEIIRTMRKKGSTFALIAEYLRDKGIPTFSGRGEWHAQTIHRLCK